MNTTRFKKILQVLFLVFVGGVLCSCQVNDDLSEQSNQQEKSPRQVLEEQLIDDTHDAFLVDTGGKLGTLLITVEVVGEREGDAGRQKTIFSVWNPKKMEQPMQTFSKKIMEGIAPEFHNVADTNFDGFQDFGYLYSLGNQPNYWHYWLWDEEQAQFIYCESLTDISAPQFDTEKKVVTGWARDGASNGEYTIYRWNDGKLSLARTIEFDGPTKDGMSIGTVKDLIGGKMVEVYRTEWDWKEETRQLDSKWYDLDYHGEPE